MTYLTDEDREALDQAIRNWEDFGGPVLDGVVPAVERIVARHRAEAWDEGHDHGVADGQSAGPVMVVNPYRPAR